VDGGVAAWLHTLSAAPSADAHVAGRPAARHVRQVLSMLGTYQRRLRATAATHGGTASAPWPTPVLRAALEAVSALPVYANVPSVRQQAQVLLAAPKSAAKPAAHTPAETTTPAPAKRARLQ
jgi:hypothetical protein